MTYFNYYKQIALPVFFGFLTMTQAIHFGLSSQTKRWNITMACGLLSCFSLLSLQKLCQSAEKQLVWLPPKYKLISHSSSPCKRDVIQSWVSSQIIPRIAVFQRSRAFCISFTLHILTWSRPTTTRPSTYEPVMFCARIHLPSKHDGPLTITKRLQARI